MRNIVDDFPLLSRLQKAKQPLHYLDSASTSQKPQQVIDAIVTTYTTLNANPDRGVYALAEAATTAYQKARKNIAHFINADMEEVIVVRGATEGINVIAQGWGNYHLHKGDEIVLTELEHHANLVPWQRVAQQTGAILKFIPITKEGNLDYHSIDALITRKTKLVAVTHSSNAIGTPVDIALIIARAKEVGALVLIDASQSAPHSVIDVKNLGVDFLVFSGHKMLGPTASGILFVKAERAHEVQPLTVGGGSVTSVDWHEAQLRSAPEKFEAGTVSLASAIGLSAAVDYLAANVTFEALQRHEAMLCARLIDGVTELSKKITILGPQELLRSQGHMVTFAVEGIHAHDVAAFLDQWGRVCVRAGHFCAQPLMKKLGYPAAVRASFYCYSTLEDVHVLMSGLKQLL